MIINFNEMGISHSEYMEVGNILFVQEYFQLSLLHMYKPMSDSLYLMYPSY